MVEFEFRGVDWEIEYHSSPDEIYIESIRIDGGLDLYFALSNYFIEQLMAAFIKHLEKEAKRSAEEDAGQQFLENGENNVDINLNS